MKKCQENNCPNIVRARNLCNKHYIALYRKPESRSLFVRDVDDYWNWVKAELGIK